MRSTVAEDVRLCEAKTVSLALRQKEKNCRRAVLFHFADNSKARDSNAERVSEAKTLSIVQLTSFLKQEHLYSQRSSIALD